MHQLFISYNHRFEIITLKACNDGYENWSFQNILKLWFLGSFSFFNNGSVLNRCFVIFSSLNNGSIFNRFLVIFIILNILSVINRFLASFSFFNNVSFFNHIWKLFTGINKFFEFNWDWFNLTLQYLADFWNLRSRT